MIEKKEVWVVESSRNGGLSWETLDWLTNLEACRSSIELDSTTIMGVRRDRTYRIKHRKMFDEVIEYGA